MKALTVWQPWASLIVHGFKPYEFRKWPGLGSMEGQRIVIHAAGRNVDQYAVDDLIWQCQAGGWGDSFVSPLALNLLLRNDWPLSAGLGTVIHGKPVRCIDIASELRASPLDICEDAWAWPMEEPDRWADQIPCRGRQGLWEWPA